jgi:pimeloyl-ACP methyl ester carboxylesterase
MRLDPWAFAAFLWAAASAVAFDSQQPLIVESHPGDETPDPTTPISWRLFSSLERTARLVDIAYCVGTTGVSKPFSCISRCSEFPSLNLVTTWNTGVLLSDSCGYIAVDHGVRRPDAPDGGAVGKHAIIVAFRGTYSITNTVVDLSTIPQEYVPYPAPGDGDGDGDGDGEGGHPSEPQHRCNNCTVHMGFLASWRSARSAVLPLLKTLKKDHPGYPIWLIGHSLGGAVAALAALELRVSLGWDNIEVTTFGEPRIGNHGLAEFVDGVFDLKGDGNLEDMVYRRVTHMNDPVPLLPLTEWGFRPHAGEVFIAKSDLSPEPDDVRHCVGDSDERCIAGSESRDGTSASWWSGVGLIPARLKLWQLFFAHRDYFWRLGLCVPGGDPRNWGKKYAVFPSEEL